MAEARTSSSAGVMEGIRWDELRAIVGEPYVRHPASDDAVLGVLPQMLVEPGNESELAAALRWADQNGLAVIPRGGGTKMEWGNPPARADIVLSTGRLNHVLEHAWADLTVSVESGVTVEQLQNTLAAHGQRLATDPLFPERATIGGILSTNDSGTLRLRFGALRDLIIGITIALPDGTIASSGGKVVKNVAGYDLPKLITGAFGTLGVITRAVFRLHPLPRVRRSLTFRCENFQKGNELLLAIQASKLAHTALQLRGSGEGNCELDVRFAGTDAGLDAQSAAVRSVAASAHETGTSMSVWNSLQELWADAENCLIAKFSVMPTDIGATCEQFRQVAGTLNWRAVIQGTGLGWIRMDASDAAVLRSSLSKLRSHIQTFVVLRRPATLAGLDVWGVPGDSFPLMLAVKRQFDPNGTLNPGRFVGGI